MQSNIHVTFRTKRIKQEEVKVGSTYCNRGAGTTFRKVLAIGDEHRPKVYFSSTGEHPVGIPGVRYEQYRFDRKGNKKGQGEKVMYLHSFTSWIGSEVEGSE